MKTYAIVTLIPAALALVACNADFQQAEELDQHAAAIAPDAALEDQECMAHDTKVECDANQKQVYSNAAKTTATITVSATDDCTGFDSVYWILDKDGEDVGEDVTVPDGESTSPKRVDVPAGGEILMNCSGGTEEDECCTFHLISCGAAFEPATLDSEETL